MGNVLHPSTEGARGSKRKRDDESTDQVPAPAEPKRRKLSCTTEYIYKTLFVEGQNSDITIVALGMEWHLHKIYLCQSGYFATMFNGRWKEARTDIVRIGIEDPRITQDALKTTFGALYVDEVTIHPEAAVSVLAAATLFQMDGLIRVCCEAMEECISLRTVLHYYDTAVEYGSVSLKQKCFAWFEKNLMYAISRNVDNLRGIEVDLMRSLVESPKLVVIQTEFSLYLLLLAWVFLRRNSTWGGDPRCVGLEARRYFRERRENCSFLESQEGEQYAEVFRSLRLKDLIIRPRDLDICEADNVMPKSMLSPVFRTQWCTMLRVDYGSDAGPNAISEEIFNKHCRRCGRVLTRDGRNVWRWTGYSFGMDIVVTFHRIPSSVYAGFSALKFKRNDWSELCTLRYRPSTARRNISYSVSVYSLHPSGEATLVSDSGMRTMSLARDEEKQVLLVKMDGVRFPLIVSAYWMTTSTPDAGTDAVV